MAAVAEMEVEAGEEVPVPQVAEVQEASDAEAAVAPGEVEAGEQDQPVHPVQP